MSDLQVFLKFIQLIFLSLCGGFVGAVGAIFFFLMIMGHMLGDGSNPGANFGALGIALVVAVLGFLVGAFVAIYEWWKWQSKRSSNTINKVVN